MNLLVDLNPDMTAEERIEALNNVAIKSPEQLKKWLQASGRKWLIFDSLDLVDALRWPDGVDLLMQVIACYRNRRASLDTGRTEVVFDETRGGEVEIPVFKGEGLELDEMQQVVVWLLGEIRKEDPEWTPEVPRT
jgi:hypothetical protein